VYRHLYESKRFDKYDGLAVVRYNLAPVFKKYVCVTITPVTKQSVPNASDAWLRRGVAQGLYFNIVTGEAIASPVMKNASPVTGLCLRKVAEIRGFVLRTLQKWRSWPPGCPSPII